MIEAVECNYFGFSKLLDCVKFLSFFFFLYEMNTRYSLLKIDFSSLSYTPLEGLSSKLLGLESFIVERTIFNNRNIHGTFFVTEK